MTDDKYEEFKSVQDIPIQIPIVYAILAAANLGIIERLAVTDEREH